MVDWNGLFQWSMHYQDGTSPSQFKPMSDEDKKWLDQAFSQYTFNDVQRLKEVCEELKSHQTLEKDKLLQLLDELSELVELHPRNNLNLCLVGGLPTLLEIIFDNKDEEVRRNASPVLAMVCQNNKEVQQFARKYQTINLVHQYVREKDIKNREAVLGALSSFCRGDNYESKREFLESFNGLSFLECVIQEGINQSPRLLKKALFFLYELVINDDQIFTENPTYIRQGLYDNKDFANLLIKTLVDSDLENHQYLDIREYILIIFKYLANFKPEFLEYIKPALEDHKQRMALKEQSVNNDLQELLKKELILVQDVFSSPETKISSNYDGGNDTHVITVNKNDNSQKQEKVLALGI